MNIKYYICNFCHNPVGAHAQAWALQNYGPAKFTGFCCGDCFDKIGLDPWGNPKQPEEYLLAILKYK